MLLWITFFCNLLVIYYLASWLPLVLRDLGVPLDDALRLGGIVPWAGIVSTLVLGPVVDRLGATRVVTVLYVLAAAFVFAIGLSGASIALLSITIFGAGMCIIGGQSFINVLSATIYPTAARSTGVGWALGVGRVGAIIGPARWRHAARRAHPGAHPLLHDRGAGAHRRAVDVRPQPPAAGRRECLSRRAGDRALGMVSDYDPRGGTEWATGEHGWPGRPRAALTTWQAARASPAGRFGAGGTGPKRGP